MQSKRGWLSAGPSARRPRRARWFTGTPYAIDARLKTPEFPARVSGPAVVSTFENGRLRTAWHIHTARHKTLIVTADAAGPKRWGGGRARKLRHQATVRLGFQPQQKKHWQRRNRHHCHDTSPQEKLTANPQPSPVDGEG